MLVLGIESTAHTLGLGLIDERGRVRANLRAVFTTEQGGIHPREAAAHHIANYPKLLDQIAEKLDKVTLIGFAKGPGLGPCLRVGAAAARSLGQALNVPVIGVNHCIAHIEIGKLKTGLKDPVTLYVSGANTQILALAAGRYRVFGETLDIGVGNFLDNFGRLAGLGFPAGPKIEQLAKAGKKYIPLPYTIKGMDFSFSGILTKLRGLIGKHRLEDLCYSVQETVFAMLVEATERALAHIDKNEILLTGGVGANQRLQQMLAIMAKERRAKFAAVPKELAGDNGVMIAWQALLEYEAGRKQDLNELQINQKWRTDEVDVIWKT